MYQFMHVSESWYEHNTFKSVTETGLLEYRNTSNKKSDPQSCFTKGQ